MAIDLLVRAKPLPVADPSRHYYPIGLPLPCVLVAIVVGCGPDSGRLPTYPVTGEVVFADGRCVGAGLNSEPLASRLQRTGFVGSGGGISRIGQLGPSVGLGSTRLPSI